jgi:hypothetical protein
VPHGPSSLWCAGEGGCGPVLSSDFAQPGAAVPHGPGFPLGFFATFAVNGFCGSAKIPCDQCSSGVRFGRSELKHKVPPAYSRALPIHAQKAARANGDPSTRAR